MKMIIPTICLLTLTTYGCGKNVKPERNNSVFEELQTVDGNYKAILRPLNFTIAGWIPNGMVDIKISGDHFEVKSWLDDSANVMHIQNIHTGTQCPGIEDDANGDGFVDFNESKKVAKQILFPLDGDLNSFAGGNNIFPKGDFTYTQSASLAHMRKDMKENNLDINVNLKGKIIIVLGSANRALPTTVSTVKNLNPELSIPIACGIIERMPDDSNI